MPAGWLAAGAAGIGVPVISAGGASARHGLPGGLPGLRVTAWIAYGLSMLDAAGLNVLGLEGFNPPSGVITSCGLLGTFSLAAMAVDATVSGSQAAMRRDEISAGERAGPSVRLTVMPTLTSGDGRGPGNPHPGVQVFLLALY